MFFMNMLPRREGQLCGYVPGNIPDDVTNVTANSPTELTFTLTSPVNQYWFTLQRAVADHADAGRLGHHRRRRGARLGWLLGAAYGTADAACTAVYTFLSNAGRLQPDQPEGDQQLAVHLRHQPAVAGGRRPVEAHRASTPTGNVTFVPNPTYSGPIKPTHQEVHRAPVHVGLPPSSTRWSAATSTSATCRRPDVTATHRQPAQGRAEQPPADGNFNLDAALHLVASTTSRTTSTRPVTAATPARSSTSSTSARPSVPGRPAPVHQEALQGLRRRRPTGRCPCYPANPYASTVREDQPLPLQPGQGQGLLTSHGWKVVPNGTDTCIKPGTATDECGAGIPAGTPLSLRRCSTPAGSPTHRTGERREVVVVARPASTCTLTGGLLQHGHRHRHPLPDRAAPGRCRTGAAAGSSPRTTTRPVRTSSAGAGVQLRRTTPTPTNDADHQGHRHHRRPLDRRRRTTWPSSCPVVWQPN